MNLFSLGAPVLTGCPQVWPAETSPQCGIQAIFADAMACAFGRVCRVRCYPIPLIGTGKVASRAVTIHAHQE